MLDCDSSASLWTAAAASATGLQFHLSYWNWYWHSTRPSRAPRPTHGIASGLRRHTSSCCSTNPGRRPHISPVTDDESSDCRCAPGRVTGAVDDIAVWRPIYLHTLHSLISQYDSGAQPRLKSWGRPRFGSQHRGACPPPRARPKAGLMGVGCGRRSLPPVVRVRGYDPRKICENSDKSCILVTTCCEISCLLKTTAKKLGRPIHCWSLHLKVGGGQSPRSLRLLCLY